MRVFVVLPQGKKRGGKLLSKKAWARLKGKRGKGTSVRLKLDQSQVSHKERKIKKG